jgi:hypothetical protein
MFTSMQSIQIFPLILETFLSPWIAWIRVSAPAGTEPHIFCVQGEKPQTSAGSESWYKPGQSQQSKHSFT